MRQARLLRGGDAVRGRRVRARGKHDLQQHRISQEEKLEPALQNENKHEAQTRNTNLLRYKALRQCDPLLHVQIILVKTLIF